MREEVRRLTTGLTKTADLPPLLDAALTRLESSPWPEVLTTWSRLTPSGFPIELTIGPAPSPLRWTAEVAGPEVAEGDRLSLAAALLADSNQRLTQPLLEALLSSQDGSDLRWGAWLGGREDAYQPGRLKLYAEVPAGVLLGTIVTERVGEVLALLPSGSGAHMVGVEPSRNRTEVYLALPAVDPLHLLPFLLASGHASALSGLERGLPDGLRRLAGRRLGLSVAFGKDDALELALFTSARTLFAMEPAQLVEVAPHIGELDSDHGRAGMVTIGLDPSGRGMPVGVGWSPRRRRSPRHDRLERDPVWRPPGRVRLAAVQ